MQQYTVKLLCTTQIENINIARNSSDTESYSCQRGRKVRYSTKAMLSCKTCKRSEIGVLTL